MPSFCQTYAETTLAKAEGALRDKGTELEALRVELAAVKEALSSSTERVEKLLEEGQVNGVYGNLICM